MFWRRTLSVVVLVPLILLLIYLGSWFYLLLITAAVLMMQVEYCRLAGNFGGKLNPIIPTILTVAFCLFAFFLPTPIENANTSLLMFSFFIVVFIYAFASSIYRGKVAGELLAVTLKLTGILTIGWAFGYHFILLRKADAVGMQLIFLLIGTIWCSDTGAYLIGRAVGKHKLSTPISPRKTVEGTIAGLVVGTLISIGFGAIFLSETLSLANAAFIGLLLSILGQLGDLSVSLMKRTAGVKDSGDFIPGHGGFLDRCDSLIFSAPILYYYLALTGILT
ncbi:phosphatidate cytidylyltransferase [Candidatus Poribacteria bacterium]|nr:phosphatidate cytidylyltransferase [Candidatus Poribacteria bacterium]